MPPNEIPLDGKIFIILLRFCALWRPAACFLPPYSKVCVSYLNSYLPISIFILPDLDHIYSQKAKLGIVGGETFCYNTTNTMRNYAMNMELINYE